jgi:hypothetical protein
MTNLVMTGKEGSVYKGAENDTYVRKPEYIVKSLVRAGLLPKTAHVEVVELPALSMRRSALFGVKFSDLSKRQDAIANFVDEEAIHDPAGIGVSPLDGRQTVSLLSEMMAHGHVHRPEMIANDALLQGLCQAIAVPAVYKALTSGAAEGFTQMIHTLKQTS